MKINNIDCYKNYGGEEDFKCKINKLYLSPDTHYIYAKKQQEYPFLIPEINVIVNNEEEDKYIDIEGSGSEYKIMVGQDNINKFLNKFWIPKIHLKLKGVRIK
jgi:hypothetical protein